MGVKISSQFNRPVVDLMSNSANNSQILQIKIGSSKTKAITGFHCGYIDQANIGGVPATAQAILANQFVQGRLTLIAEPLDLSAFTPAQLLGSFQPFQAPIDFNGMTPSNILFDIPVINIYNVDFSSPFIVPDGAEMSVILSTGFTAADVGTGAPGTRVGWLNVRGDMVSEFGKDFPYILR